jgi:hypothetical protein
MKEKDCKYFKPYNNATGECTYKLPWWVNYAQGDGVGFRLERNADACPAFKRKIDSLWALNKGD